MFGFNPYKLENENISIQYRKSILSFIKKSLQEYDNEKFKLFYNEKDNIIKPYTFAIFFRNSIFKGDEIIVGSKTVEMNFSTYDYESGVILYNAFNHQKNKKFSLNKNSMTLRNIILVPEKDIVGSEATIKFLSPLVVRERENNKDYYYSFNDENFLITLRNNIKNQLSISNLPLEYVNEFSIEPVKAKKAVIKFYEKKIETSLGIYIIHGNPELLDYLYKTGMGSKHSSGFGMFDLI